MFKNFYIFLFKLRSLLFLKKYQKEFFYIEKYKEIVSLYDKKFLIVQNYCFELKKKIKNKFSFGKKVLKAIIIIYSKNKYFNYKLDNERFQKKIDTRTINFLKFENINNKKLELLTNQKDKVLNVIKINKKSQKKLVLIILLDGLNYKISNNLKYSKKFFKHSSLNNFWSNAEWTMPSFANLITGNLTSTHGLYNHYSFYNNKKNSTSLKDENTLFKFFSSKGFVTGCYTGCVRINPTYNLLNNIDIFKHCDQEKGENIVEYVKGQLELFKDTSNFIFLHLLDGHHVMDTGLKKSNFAFQNPKHYKNIYNDFNDNMYKKTPFRRYSNSAKSEILSLYSDADLILDNLYSYLDKKNYDDYTIMLMGDHGKVMDNEPDQHRLLCNDMNNIGFFIKDKKFKNFNKKKMHNIIDIFPSLCERYGRNIKLKKFDGFNTLYNKRVNRKLTISESLFKDKLQIAVRKNDLHFHADKNFGEKKFNNFEFYKKKLNKIKKVKIENKIFKYFNQFLKSYKKI